MHVLDVGDQLHLAAQQLTVVTSATQVLQGDGSLSGGAAPSLQIFVECKQHTQRFIFSPRLQPLVTTGDSDRAASRI